MEVLWYNSNNTLRQKNQIDKQLKAKWSEVI